MKRISKSMLVFFLSIFVVSLIIAGCGPAPVQVGTGGATQVETLGFTIPKNSQGNTVEQQNIIDRLKVTTDPTKVLWIHLIALDGRIILRTPVAHKVTSSGKRLEPMMAATGSSGFYLPSVTGTNYYTPELIEPDGTFGSSDAYIFWFDPMHRYFQYGTAGGIGYLLTDFPIDLTNPLDAITGMYNADHAAFQWQQDQQKTMVDQATAGCQANGKTFDSETGGCK